MLRLYVEIQERLRALTERATADDGVTVPEYMLVLGVISIAVVVLFNTAAVQTAVSGMSANLAAMIGTSNP